jgi:hypothetical protein
MFGKRDSKVIPSNKLFLGSLYTHVYGHPIPKQKWLEYNIPSGYYAST